MNSVFEKMQQIASYLDGFNATWVIGLGCRHKLFRYIFEHDEGVTIEQLASNFDCDFKVIKTWCEAAYGFELIRFDEDRIQLCEYVKDILVDEQSTLNQSGFYEYALAASKNYDKFERIISGGSYINIFDYGNDYVEGIMNGGIGAYLTIINEFIPKHKDIRKIFEKNSTILEVGCGCGQGILRLGGKYPLCCYKGIDIDYRAINIARDLLKNEPTIDAKFYVSDAVDFIFKEKFDLIFMLWVIHEIENPIASIRLLRKYLKEKGQLLIFEVPYPDNPISSKPNDIKSFCGIQFGEVLQGASLMAPDYVIRLFEKAEFSIINKIQIHDFLYAYHAIA